MDIDRVKTLSDIVSVWIGLIALILGGLFAVKQYVDKDKADRIKYSIDSLERFNKDHLLEARQGLDALWDAKRETFNKKVSGGGDEFNEFVDKAIRDDHDAKAQVISLLDFYETLDICIAREICDPETTLALFQADARRFYRLHYGFLQGQRQLAHDPTFGCGLERLQSKHAEIKYADRGTPDCRKAVSR